MQHLPAPIHHARDAAQLPVAIDYPAALALRKMLLATLWNTGARINEALALTRGDF